MFAMAWKRKLSSKSEIHYRRLHVKRDDQSVLRGYVPLLVGGDDEDEEKFVVHLTQLKNPNVSCLLDMAAQEFGYGQQGVLRIPCDVQQFKLIFNQISKSA